ncbi:MAG: T9SS type A sorting domain-containing protein, partial [candidate division WOR-3 bacterium]|nr:T9SS type A sorting domain-containing protein [candidate division WOR-3 bacterium]
NSKLVVYPNPFKTQTTIRFALSTKDKVILKIYDVSGKLVKSFSSNNPTRSVGQAKRDQPLKTNNYFVWKGIDDSGKSVPPGVYCIRLITQNYLSVTRVVRQ